MGGGCLEVGQYAMGPKRISRVGEAWAGVGVGGRLEVGQYAAEDPRPEPATNPTHHPNPPLVTGHRTLALTFPPTPSLCPPAAPPRAAWLTLVRGPPARLVCVGTRCESVGAWPYTLVPLYA